ncbi:MAG: GAF domain-containing protein [Nitrospirae bacterium]|nr:GAF domain-containing protein [Nitrospirota bacterium]
MKSDGTHKPAYIQKIQEETKQFTQNLLIENDRIRLLAAKLQSEKTRIEEQLEITDKELGRYIREEARWKEQMSKIEEESRRFSQEYIEVEKQNSNLANLYVASYRLHSTLDRQEVLLTIQEIVTNLIGSEEMALFELDSRNSSLTCLSSMGIEEEHYKSVPLGAGLIGRAVSSGELYSAKPGQPPGAFAGECDLTACIPLKVGGKVIGAIAIFRLLEQKPGLEAVDFELFDLLATHAAVALYCTRRSARETAGIVE